MNARDEWLNARKLGIGGTDMAVVLGLSPYKTPLQLWLEKTGRSDETPAPDAEERMYWGTALEDVVARRYAELHGCRVQRVNDPLVHPGGVVRGNIDRAIINPDIAGNVRFKNGRLTTDRILEVKTAHAMAQNSDGWGQPGTDEVPQHYWVQLQTYLGLSGCESADLAVLFGGQKMVVYSMQADSATFADMVELAGEWWAKHVVSDLPPPATTEDDAKRLWRSHKDGKDRIVDRSIADAVSELKAAKEEIDALERYCQGLRNMIMPAFEDAESISYMGNKLATWKQNRPSSKTDWKSIASHIGYSQEIFDANTVVVEGARVLRLLK